MMKRIIAFLIMSTFSFAAVASEATFRCDDVTILDHPVPWPWGLEQPFPWTDIKGLWRIENSKDASPYFTFKVIKGKTADDRQLAVREIDPDSCDVIATGVGYELNKIVRAQMTTDKGTSFRIAVRAFREIDSPQSVAGRIETNQVMVLSIMGISTDSNPSVHMQIGKLSESIDLKKCSNLKK
jgi:hypothetical protein